ETLLREHLCEHPTDVAAIRMFAEVAARLGRYQDAENLLARCLELAPGFTARATTTPSRCSGRASMRRRYPRSSGCWPSSRATPIIEVCTPPCWLESASMPARPTSTGR